MDATFVEHPVHYIVRSQREFSSSTLDREAEHESTLGTNNFPTDRLHIRLRFLIMI